MIHKQNLKTISVDQINDEIGLGRNRTEMNPTPPGIEQTPTIEEQAIFEELGLGKVSCSADFIEQNDKDSE